MVKEPKPGRVKTRLGKDIGVIPATWWFRHQTRRLIRRVGYDPRWQTWLAVAPDVAIASRQFEPRLRRIPQGGGDLGARMRKAFAQMPNGPALVVGADVPGITATEVWAAFCRLLGSDVVFGPARDGGYWLVGRANPAAPQLGFLKDVRWSSPHALSDSMRSLPPATRIATTTELSDVDTASDLPSAARL